MLRTFNMGIGLIVVAAEKDSGTVLDGLMKGGERDARAIGRIVGGGEGVRYVNS